MHTCTRARWSAAAAGWRLNASGTDPWSRPAVVRWVWVRLPAAFRVVHERSPSRRCRHTEGRMTPGRGMRGSNTHHRAHELPRQRSTLRRAAAHCHRVQSASAIQPRRNPEKHRHQVEWGTAARERAGGRAGGRNGRADRMDRAAHAQEEGRVSGESRGRRRCRRHQQQQWMLVDLDGAWVIRLARCAGSATRRRGIPRCPAPAQRRSQGPAGMPWEGIDPGGVSRMSAADGAAAPSESARVDN